MVACRVQELDPVVLAQNDEGEVSIRVFRLFCNGIVLEVSSLGASITKFLVPSESLCDDEAQNNEIRSHDTGNKVDRMDDIVLGFPSAQEMYQSGNPPYFGVVVGRVANRIVKGQLRLPCSSSLSAGDENVEYKTIQLDINNGPNHLHGGINGFSKKIWNAEIISSDSVQFTLLSKYGDAGYPGTVQVTATYQLQPLESDLSIEQDNSPKNVSSLKQSIRLTLSFHAQLLEEGSAPCCTPINLAQHTYFNLNRHDDPQGILDHTLHLDGCVAYTPVDADSIPTRQVVPLANDSSMNLQSEPVVLKQALIDFGVHKAALPLDQVEAAVSQRNLNIHGTGGENEGTALPPFGLDHNFVVADSKQEPVVQQQGDAVLTRIGTAAHAESKRRLTVWTNTPGVQVYTANYVSTSSSDKYKDGAKYQPWQALCLETQHFPDSIGVDPEMHPDFAKGRCVILTPTNPTYQHTVVYDLEYQGFASLVKPKQVVPNTMLDNMEGSNDISTWVGRDTDSNRYPSIQAMWESQGITAGSSSSSSSSWYARAAEHYQNNCEATLDGVLGGFARLTESDLAGSLQFVQSLQQLNLLKPTSELANAVACECGAGIGRVSRGLLLPLGFGRVDLVESASHLLAVAPDFIGDEGADKCRYLCTDLQDWVPSQPGMYSLIWIQWVFCYLTDKDAIRFLEQCRIGLQPHGGLIVLKENTVGSNSKQDDDGTITESALPQDDFVLDLEDASLTRSVRYIVHLAREAGLKVVHLQESQSNFPNDIFPVPMIAFAPA
ncbi:hypothetical protein ACA910_007734 [Epithemia clementina (nom. ined.)]